MVHITQTETIEIILPSGDVYQVEVTFAVSWDTIQQILKMVEDGCLKEPKNDLPRTNDGKLIGLNAVGLSLGRIGRDLGVHHTTVTQRLKQLGVTPADTRRAFMEDIWDSLTEPQREWLIERLGAGQSVKDFIRSLIVNDYIRSKQK